MPPFALICAASALVALSTFAHGLLLPLYMKEAGLSEAYIGLVIGVMSLSLVFGRFASGWAIDRWGARAFLVGGALLWAVSSPLVLFTYHPFPLTIIRLLQGLALAFFTNAAIGYVSHAFTEEVRGRGLALWWMAWSSAVAIGPLLAGAVLHRWGFDAAFVVTGLLGLTAAAPSMFVQNIKLAHEDAPALTFVPKPALIPGFVGLTVGFASGGFGTFLPLEGRALGMRNPGFLLAALGIGIVLAQFVFGRLSDRRGRHAAILPGFVIALAATLLFLRLEGVSAAMVLAFMVGVGTSGLSPVLTAWAVDRSADFERTSAAGSSVAFREVGSFAGASAMGALLAVGRPWAFAVVATVLAAGLVLARMNGGVAEA